MPSWLPTDTWQALSKRIRNEMGGVSLFRAGVDGDGACFFHSLALLINTENYRAAGMEQRKNIVRRMRAKIAARTKDSEIAREISDYSNWANESVIATVQNMFKINVIFWCLDTNEVQAQVPVLDVERYPTVMIAWVEREHFEPIFVCIGAEDGYRVMQGVFEPADPHVPVLRSVENKIKAKHEASFGEVVLEGENQNQGSRTL